MFEIFRLFIIFNLQNNYIGECKKHTLLSIKKKNSNPKCCFQLTLWPLGNMINKHTLTRDTTEDEYLLGLCESFELPKYSFQIEY